MVQVFTKSGFRYENYLEPYEPNVSKAFIKKHGKEKTEEICRQIMIRFKEVDETKHSFTSEVQHCITVDASVRDALKLLAEQRGLAVSSLVREALHSHLLKNTEPVRRMTFKPASVRLCLSPFEEKLLKQWRERNNCGFNDFLSTLASASKPLLDTDLPALTPRQGVLLYPDRGFLEGFLHSVHVYGYSASSLFRQILAFLDRPFDPNRVQDRYLDWLVGGYAHALSPR